MKKRTLSSRIAWKVCVINKDFRGFIAIKHEFHLFICNKEILQLVFKFKESKPFAYTHGHLDDTKEPAEIDHPRLLCNMVCVVVGAIYIDMQMDLTMTWNILCPMIQPTINLGTIDWACIFSVLEIQFQQLRRTVERSTNIQDVFKFGVSWIPKYIPVSNKFSSVCKSLLEIYQKIKFIVNVDFHIYASISL